MSKQRFVFGSLLFACALIAQAQQSADWRPNIAEDNKSATWENTVAFLENTVVASGSSYPCNENACQSTSRVVSVDSPSSCTLNVRVENQYYWYSWHDHFRLQEGNISLNLSSVDPLSILVQPNPENIGHTPRVVMKGTNNGKIGESSECVVEGSKVAELRTAATTGCTDSKFKAK